MKLSLQIFNYTLVKNAAADTADLFIDGDIVDEPTREMLADWWGDETSVSFKSVRDKILTCGTKNINITTNSGGGHVADAMAMHDFINDLNTNQGYNIRTKTCGMSASAATYISMAGGKDKSSITKNSFFMIHNVSGAIWGDVNVVENYARTLRKFNDVITNFYAEATGLPVETIKQWMDEETWFTGEEAANHGFIGECIGKENFKNALTPEKFPFANKAILNKYNSYTNNDKGMKKNKIANAITAAFAKLGLGNDANLNSVKVQDLKAAIVDALGQQEDDEVDQEAIGTAVANAFTANVQGEAFTNAVNTAVANVLNTMPDSITNAIKTQVENSTKDFATTAALEKLNNDIAEKIIVPKNDKKKDAPEDKGAFNHSGITWGDTSSKGPEDDEEED